MNLRPLEYPDAIQWISDSMLVSDQYWFSLVYYKPWNAIMYITTLSYMKIDEPGLRLSKEAYKLVNEFSRKNHDFIFSPSMKDEERAGIVEEFIASLPMSKKEEYTPKWKKESARVLDNWRPSAIYSFFGNEEIGKLWEDFFTKRLEPAVKEFAKANNIDLYSLSYYIVQ